MEYILYEQKGYIATITINREKALNALNSQVLDELNEVLDGALGLHLMEQSHQNTTSGSSYRMTQGNRAAVGIQLLVYINTQLFSYCYGLCRKGLVCLDNVKVLNLHAGLCQHLFGD